MTLSERSERTYPFSVEDWDEIDIGGNLPWGDFRSWLLKEKKGSENGSPDSIYVDYGDDGTINFNGKDGSVYLDTHSEWPRVLEAFEVIHRMGEDTLLFDLQEGVYHDIDSFKELLRDMNSNQTSEVNEQVKSLDN